MRLSLIALAVSTVLLSACNKGGEAAPTAATSTPAPAATASADRVGVAACDAYLDKYQACIADKVPAAARSQFEASLGQTRASWKGLAANTATAASLESACKQATDAARQGMSAYGCTF